MLLDDSRFIRDATNDRLRAAFDGAAPTSVPVLAYGPAASDRFAVWGQGFGSWVDWNSNDQVPSLDRTVGGFLVGGDAPFGEYARIGALAGYSRTSIDEASLDASAAVPSSGL